VSVVEQQTSLAAAGAEGQELVIRAPSRWGGLSLRELWDYRELWYFLTKRDVQVRYKQSLLGISWAVAQPVGLALVFYIFFGRLAKIPSEGLPYPVFAMGALVSWNFASQAVAQSAASLISDANLLSKVYFPRLLVPLAKVGSLAVDLCVAIVVLTILMAAYLIAPPVQVLTLPLFLALAALIGLGAGTFLAALNVRYRDVGVALPLLLQVWLFATPVVYPASLVSGVWSYVYALNPMVSVVSGTRWALFDTPAPPLGALAVSCVVSVLIAVVALVYFRRVERFFADVI
jgi:lipopolysaccharide transport system permease protein